MLAPGTRLGPYEITATLGAGGMGEVYRARDAKLNRDVAIKVLPDAFASDRERLVRFEREAQTLAALNHPNIAQIYGVIEIPSERGSQAIDMNALVMELVEGEDLAQRIARGPVPLDEALAIARQIAGALEAAHEQGIVHRDLKPANIKVRRDGTVKVLDFGLAKAMDPVGMPSGPAIANSPTFTSPATMMGVVIGTAAYMAPEQARGKAVDRRADVWAFGVVLYEMLTGRRAFEGDEISDVLASVLKSDVGWTVLPAETPASVRRLLRRCLEKDPRRRLSAIGDARLELDEDDAPAPARTVVASPPRRRVARDAVVFLTGALLTGALGALLWTTGAPRATSGVQRFSLLPPPGAALFPDSTGVVISPDGTMVAFVVGSQVRSDTQIWVRTLDSMIARRLEDTDGGTLPFWSPDSRQLGFFTTTKLKVVAISGGRPRALADIHGGGRGATWNGNNTIVFAGDPSGPLLRISATGGTPSAATTLDPSRKQNGHRFPSFLPDGDHFTYTALPGRNGKFDIFVGALSGGAPVLLGSMDSAPVFAPPGYLLYLRQGALTAQPFNVRALRLTGDPITLSDEPSMILDPVTSYTAALPVSIAANESLAYYSSPSLNTTADVYDAKGQRTGTLALPPGHYESLRISPDGTHAVLVRSVSSSESSLWLADLVRGGATPLSSGPGRNDSPVWSADGTKVIFSADRDGPQDFFVKTIGEASPEQPLFRSDLPFKNPNAWTPDGSIVMTQIVPGTGQDVWLIKSDGSAPPTPLVSGPRREIGSNVSPDGRWLLYCSDETGRYQLYAQSFPTPGHRVQVSQNGGLSGVWSRDGRQIVIVGDDMRSLWRVDVTTGETFSAGPPTLIAQLPPNVLGVDVAPDLQRFVAVAPDRSGTGAMTVVQNWRAALGR